MTHPVNKVWVEDIAMSGAGSDFFTTLAGQRTGNWTELRNACELSHVVIACFATLSLISIAMAASLIGRES